MLRLPPVSSPSTIAHPMAKPQKESPKDPKLGALPEWNLDDLYPGPDSPELKWDLENAETRCVAFEADFKGKLAELAAGPEAGKALAAAVQRYEALDDTLGRVMSYASLRYAGNTADPAIAKFYGDMQDRITAASLHLLFFTLELNRVDDDKLDAALTDPALGHYRPWIEDVRKEKPYQLEDRVEALFHEKSVTGYSAWNRNVRRDHRLAAFPYPWPIAADRADAQSAAGRRRRQTQGGGAGAGQDLQGKLAAIHADHQHARQGQGNFRPLARLQGRRRRPPSVEPRRAAKWWRRWSPPCAPPIRNCRTATTH